MKPLIAGLLLIFACQALQANFLEYRYTGGNFHVFHSAFPSSTPAVTNLTFTFTTPTELAANSQYFLTNAISYSFYDGYTTVSDSNTGWAPLAGWVKTDSLGIIFNWSFSVERYSPWAVNEARIFDSSRITNTYEEYEDFVVYCYESTGYTCQGAKARNYSNDGAWVSTTVVPIPAGIWLFISALSGLILTQRKHP